MPRLAGVEESSMGHVPQGTMLTGYVVVIGFYVLVYTLCDGEHRRPL